MDPSEGTGLQQRCTGQGIYIQVSMKISAPVLVLHVHRLVRAGHACTVHVFMVRGNCCLLAIAR